MPEADDGTRPAAEERPGCVAGVLILLFIGLLGFFGGLLCFAGARAIDRQEFDVEWRGGGGLGVGPVVVGGIQQAGVERFRGVDAIRVGVGLLAWGVLFMLWASRLLLSRVPRIELHLLGASWGLRRKLLTALSLAGLSTWAAAFAPPWRVPSQPGPASFWLTVSLLTCLGLLRRRRAVRRWSRRVFPILVVSAIVAAQFSVSAFVGIVLAIFFFLAAAVHVALFIFEGDLGRMASDASVA